LVLLCTTSGVFAQDPQLFDTTWYVTSIDLDGTNYTTPPINDPIKVGGIVRFLQNPDFFSTYFCDDLLCIAVYDPNENKFDIEDNPMVLNGLCNSAELSLFGSQYNSLFYDDIGMNKSPFTYNLSANGSEILLSITNSEGNTAYYSNQPLSTPDFQPQSVQLFPNPAQGQLTVAAKNATITHSRVFNVQGQKVMQLNFQQNEQPIDISSLQLGVYFLKAESDTGQQFTAKFVKK